MLIITGRQSSDEHELFGRAIVANGRQHHELSTLKVAQVHHVVLITYVIIYYSYVQQDGENRSGNPTHKNLLGLIYLESKRNTANVLNTT